MDKLPAIDSETLTTNSKNTSNSSSEAKLAARRLLGCFRVGDAHDPEVYISSIVAVLQRFPVEVIRSATDPATGIASKINWLPTIKEIRDECESWMPSRAEKWAAEWDRSAKAQLAARETLKIADQRPRKTYEQLQAELAECGIFIGKQTKGAVDVGAFRQAHGITQEQWDAIPDAKRAG